MLGLLAEKEMLCLSYYEENLQLPHINWSLTRGIQGRRYVVVAAAVAE